MFSLTARCFPLPHPGHKPTTPDRAVLTRCWCGSCTATSGAAVQLPPQRSPSFEIGRGNLLDGDVAPGIMGYNRPSILIGCIASVGQTVFVVSFPRLPNLPRALA